MLDTTAMNTLSTSANLFSEFKSAAEEITKIITNHKVSTTAYHDSNLILFSGMDGERQWTSLKQLGMRPKSDIFDVVNSEDAVEAYDLGWILLFQLKAVNICRISQSFL